MKYFKCILFLLLFVTDGISQTIGLYQGTLLPNVVFNKNTQKNIVPKKSRKITYYAGIENQFKINKNIGLRIGIAFEERGYNNFNFNGDKQNYKYIYLSSPVFAEFSIAKKHSPYILTGINPAINIFGDIVDKQGSVGNGLDIYSPKYAPKFDFGITFGAGYRYLLQNKIILKLESRYNFSLNNLGVEGAFHRGIVVGSGILYNISSN